MSTTVRFSNGVRKSDGRLSVVDRTAVRQDAGSRSAKPDRDGAGLRARRLPVPAGGRDVRHASAAAASSRV
jgi:hypothetical protein